MTLPQHVRVARLLEAHGIEIQRGSFVSFVKTTNLSGVLPTFMARSADINAEKYVENLKNVFDQVLETLGVNTDPIQIRKLTDYFI